MSWGSHPAFFGFGTFLLRTGSELGQLCHVVPGTFDGKDYHGANIDRCNAAVLAGSQRMPDAEELRQKAEQAKQEIAGIDAKLMP